MGPVGTERKTCEGKEKDKEEHLSALPTDTARQLDVFGHDGDTLGVDGAEIGVLKQTHQVGLAGLLQGRKTRHAIFISTCVEMRRSQGKQSHHHFRIVWP